MVESSVIFALAGEHESRPGFLITIAFASSSPNFSPNAVKHGPKLSLLNASMLGWMVHICNAFSSPYRDAIVLNVDNNSLCSLAKIFASESAGLYDSGIPHDSQKKFCRALPTLNLLLYSSIASSANGDDLDFLVADDVPKKFNEVGTLRVVGWTGANPIVVPMMADRMRVVGNFMFVCVISILVLYLQTLRQLLACHFC